MRLTAVCSAFNVGHMVTNLYGGFLAATMSPKTVLTWGVAVWSLFTLLTPLAADLRWLPGLLLVRGVMGLGEGVAFPTMQVSKRDHRRADEQAGPPHVSERDHRHKSEQAGPLPRW